MPDFQDIFQGVTFADAKIDMSGTSTQDAGNTGIPAPVPGQKVVSPATQVAQQEPAQTPGPKPDGKTPEEKPLPYDKDPKWLKARAAEAALDKMLKTHGILDAEELEQRLARGEDLGKLLGTRDPKQLIEDAEYAARVKTEWDKQKTAKQYEGETPDVKLTRLEKENEDLRKAHETYKNSIESKEQANLVVNNFNKEVNRVISAQELPVAESERELLTLVLGIDNPSNSIDIADQTAVRKMAQEGIAKFRTLVQGLKQAAIQDYVAGKTTLAVDTTRSAPAQVPQGTQRQPLPKTASATEVFDRAKAEFTEILLKGMEAAH